MGTIITKNSATSGSVPSSLIQGELAINVANGRLFYGSGSGNAVKEFGVTSSYALNALSASYAQTASFAPAYLLLTGGTINGDLIINGTASITYLNTVYESASVIYSSGSNQFGDASNDTQTLWGTVDIKTGPVLVTGSLNALSITGSLLGTSSWAVTASHALNALSASYALTASFITASGVYGPYGSNSVISSSFAVTASSALNAQDILIRVINQSGNPISKGIVVHITASGNSSDIPRVITASYENDNNSANTLGIANETIANGAEGFIMTEGVLRGIDTSAFVSGQLIYLGPTGSIIGTAPLAPLHNVRLGQVVREQSNNGSIYVRIDNGYELGELHDVRDTTTTSSYGDLLVKSGSIWINSKQLTGSYGLTGSLTATSFTGSLQGTSSWANNAVTSSYILNAVSASFASTASFVNPLNQNVIVTGSLTSTANVQANKFIFTDGVINENNAGQRIIATSGNILYLYTGNSGLYINNQANTANNVIISDAGTLQTRGSITAGAPGNDQSIYFGGTNAGLYWASSGASIFYSVGALQFSSVGSTNNMILQNGGGALFNYGITGSLQGTSSWANNAVTASFVQNAQTASYVLQAVSASFATTAQTATTASYVLNAVSASFAATASTATSATRASTISISGISTNGEYTFPLIVTGSSGPSIGLSIDTVTGIIYNPSTNLFRVTNLSATGSLFGTSSWADNATTASYVLNAISASFASTASFVNPLIQNVSITGILGVTGSANISTSLTSSTALISGSGTNRLTVVGSGSAQPIFTVQGSQGELFSVTDSFSGSLFSVNDISGLPILEVFSDNTTLIGNYLDPMLITTTKLTTTASGAFTLYSLPTASYDTAFFDYSIKSGSNARAGSIMAIQSGTSVNFTETTTTDFGSTSGFGFSVQVSAGNIILTGSATTSGWTIKTVIRSI